MEIFVFKYEVNFHLEICLYTDACRVAGQLSLVLTALECT